MFFLVHKLCNNFVGAWSQALGIKETSQGHSGLNLLCLDRHHLWLPSAEPWCHCPCGLGPLGHRGCLSPEWAQGAAHGLLLPARAACQHRCGATCSDTSDGSQQGQAHWPWHLGLLVGVCVLRAGRSSSEGPLDAWISLWWSAVLWRIWLAFRLCEYLYCILILGSEK